MPEDTMSPGEASQESKSVGDEIKKSAGELKEDAQEKLRDLGARARETGRSAMDRARHVGREAGEEIRDRGEELVDRQKGRAADHIGNYGAAARRAADQLREEHDDVLAQYAEGLANTLDRAADYLRNRDVRDMVGSLESYTRRHPEVVLGGLFVAGLAAARIFKAASPPEEYGDFDYDEQEVDYAYEEYGPGDEPGYRMGSDLAQQQRQGAGAATSPGAYQTT